MNYIDLVLQENLDQLSDMRVRRQRELEQKIKPFHEKAKYARYSKTRFGNFLGLLYRETGVWMIFDLNGVPVCTCEDGELDSTLNELENAS